jgi:hypothetical protein
MEQTLRPYEDSSMTVKRIVVLHEDLDRCVLRAWALLLQSGVEATYSAAINFMLVGHVTQAVEELTPAAQEAMWRFARDTLVVRHLNQQDRLGHLREDFCEPVPCDHPQEKAEDRRVIDDVESSGDHPGSRE